MGDDRCLCPGRGLRSIYLAVIYQRMATTKKKTPPPKQVSEKSGRAEHPILIGLTHKEHARLARAAAKSETKVCVFARAAIEAAVSEVL